MCWEIFHFSRAVWLFSKLAFSKNSFRNTSRVSNSLDPDQDGHSVGPDLVQTVCKGFQQMTEVVASKERVEKEHNQCVKQFGFTSSTTLSCAGPYNVHVCMMLGPYMEAGTILTAMILTLVLHNLCLEACYTLHTVIMSN